MFARTTVYLGLGGNIGPADQTINSAVDCIRELRGVFNLRVSRLYQTKPISDIPQDLFVNAVCKFETCLPASTLFRRLEQIERDLGKFPKAKNEPRPIDIDLLFYGNVTYDNGYLQIPHPRWKERLFVLVPLKELTDTIKIEDSKFRTSPWSYDIPTLIRSFSDSERNDVFPLPRMIRQRPNREVDRCRDRDENIRTITRAYPQDLIGW